MPPEVYVCRVHDQMQDDEPEQAVQVKLLVSFGRIGVSYSNEVTQMNELLLLVPRWLLNSKNIPVKWEYIFHVLLVPITVHNIPCVY